MIFELSEITLRDIVTAVLVLMLMLCGTLTHLLSIVECWRFSMQMLEEQLRFKFVKWSVLQRHLELPSLQT
jgi:hypothetical protein